MTCCINDVNCIRLLLLSTELFKFEIQKYDQILCVHKPYFLMPGHILHIAIESKKYENRWKLHSLSYTYVCMYFTCSSHSTISHSHHYTLISCTVRMNNTSDSDVVELTSHWCTHQYWSSSDH